LQIHRSKVNVFFKLSILFERKEKKVEVKDEVKIEIEGFVMER